MNRQARIVDDDTTEMVQWKRKHANELATTLIGKRKPFHVSPEVDDHGEECWLFTIEERNEVGGLAGKWADA